MPLTCMYLKDIKIAREESGTPTRGEAVSPKKDPQEHRAQAPTDIRSGGLGKSGIHSGLIGLNRCLKRIYQPQGQIRL